VWKSHTYILSTCRQIPYSAGNILVYFKGIFKWEARRSMCGQCGILSLTFLRAFSLHKKNKVAQIFEPPPLCGVGIKTGYPMLQRGKWHGKEEAKIHLEVMLAGNLNSMNACGIAYKNLRCLISLLGCGRYVYKCSTSSLSCEASLSTCCRKWAGRFNSFISMP
jgi:hypothetical protein